MAAIIANYAIHRCLHSSNQEKIRAARDRRKNEQPHHRASKIKTVLKFGGRGVKSTSSARHSTRAGECAVIETLPRRDKKRYIMLSIRSINGIRQEDYWRGEHANYDL
ncbi:hypothetical protein [Paraburkholderia acidisoli]|uniref:Uncharacterized protein n=1 Tax=Paraburkholderia acidisoli TaxID=2571748 RepID=A0A7Z2JKJ8_9BURK|nr:hypothetical protein [Paraburkholderia acidisoli]QGZ66530.1 hypothetical protein FAZ98_32685 [Paraburkholderia acidisoli]